MIMLETLLAAALTATSPYYWANEYCWAMHRGSSAEEAHEIATSLAGEPDEFAIQLTKGTGNWCPQETL